MEFFADSDRADLFAPAIEAVEQLVVPVITMYEVVKKLSREAGDEVAAVALSLMQRGRVKSISAWRWRRPRSGCRWPTARSTPPLGGKRPCCGRRTPTSRDWPACSTFPSADKDTGPSLRGQPCDAKERPCASWAEYRCVA